MTLRVAGIDVGGTRVRALLAHTGSGGELVVGDVVERGWRSPGVAPTPEHLADVIASLVAELGVEAGGTLGGLDGVGLGFAGQLSPDGRVVRNAPALGWRDVALADRLAAAWGLAPDRVQVRNDLKAILAGELAAGAAVGATEVLAVYAGTGVGGAFAIRGEVAVGAGGNAGEIGHVKVPGSEASCGCGEVGCVEAIAGGGALVRRLKALKQEGAEGAEPDVAALDAAADAGHAWAVALRDEVVAGLGDVIAGACTLLNPSLLLLGGGVVERAPGLATRLEARVLARTLAVARGDLRVARGTLGDAAGAIGAAAAILAAVRGRAPIDSARGAP